MHHSNLQKRRHLLCIGSYQKIFKRENHKSVPDHLLGVLLREYSKHLGSSLCYDLGLGVARHCPAFTPESWCFPTGDQHFHRMEKIM